MNSSSDELILVRQVLSGRGIAGDAAEAFLYPDYTRHSHDPFLLTDMSQAVERILAAAKLQQKVVVYGDYDIDGITASAVLIEGLAAWGIAATSYIPDRFEEGYGINEAALVALKLAGVDLVISVDCGITSISEAKWASDHGLDLIITDHHSVGSEIPEAIAVLNPKRAADKYPFKDLAGVGVAFKLIQALQIASTGVKGPHLEIGQEKWLLDLVALGTVCDVVSLTGENRLLVHFGLKALSKTRRVGLKALAEVGGYDVSLSRSYHLGYVLGPRLNAAGRLEHAAISLELLQTSSKNRALEIAHILESLNTQRRSEQARIVDEAGRMAERMTDDQVLVLADPSWSHGVVGIAASKLVERFNRPALVMQILGDYAKGSARSTAHFNMVEALRSHKDLLTKFGGHHFAAGYSMPVANIDGLRAGLSSLAISTEVAPATIKHDLAIDDLSGIDLRVVSSLDILEPFGSANPKPLFTASDLRIIQMRTIGAERTHLKLVLGDGLGRHLEAIGFGLAQKYPDLRIGGRYDVFFELSENDFNGSKTVQLVVKVIV